MIYYTLLQGHDILPSHEFKLRLAILTQIKLLIVYMMLICESVVVLAQILIDTKSILFNSHVLPQLIEHTFYGSQSR